MLREERQRVRVVLEADGASKGNPGPAGAGALLRDPTSFAILAECAVYLGETTNNVAEYEGLIAGLGLAIDHGGIDRVHVMLDSQLVIEQMKGAWRVKDPDLADLHRHALALARRLPEVVYTHVHRALNIDADRLANLAVERGRP